MKAYSSLKAFLLVLLVLASQQALAQPEPTVPTTRGYVSDYVGVIDAATTKRLDDIITELKDKTGGEIAVVVVRSTKPLEPFDYAMKIAEAWKPGDRKKENGVVFLIAIDDRSMYILTGYGVEGVLPDGRVGEIRDRIVVPAFRRGEYSGGIREATETIAALIAQDAGVQLTGVRPPAKPQQASPLQAVLLIVGVIFVLWLMSRGGFPMMMGGGPGFPGSFGGGGGGGFGGGGFGGGGGGGGFGGFGGGDFGGGGAGGKW